MTAAIREIKRDRPDVLVATTLSAARQSADLNRER
jgi:hypothetical protein